MKSIVWLAFTRLRIARILGIVTLVAFAFACSDDSEDVALSAEAAARKNKVAQTSASTTSADAYCINVVKEGTKWTYTITLKEGAKGVSHFILDLNNCAGNQTLSINSIVWATVNGQPANLESSEGQGTGCEITTDNFVKFDDLEEAKTLVIVFELDQEYGNASPTNAWIKAGTSCFQYEVSGPCCA